MEKIKHGKKKELKKSKNIEKKIKKKERKNDVKKNQWIFKNLKKGKSWDKKGHEKYFFRYPQPSYDIKSNEIKSV